MRAMVLLVGAIILGGCGSEQQPAAAGRAGHDSAYADLQDRGAATEGMGVDQYASAHRFDDLPDGGA